MPKKEPSRDAGFLIQTNILSKETGKSRLNSTMPKITIAALNAELKAIRAGVAVQQIGDRLYLRATLPPKPDSDKSAPCQQRIALGVYANEPGVLKAKCEALRLSSDVASGRFKWSDWVAIQSTTESINVESAIALVEVEYFQRRGYGVKASDTWQGEYASIYAKLPRGPVTREGILSLVNGTNPNTRTRLRTCRALKKLAAIARADVDLDSLKGNYSPRSVDSKSLPKDSLIIEWRDRINNPAWQWAFGMMAAYGLRNHELFYVEFGHLDRLGIIVKKGKTGYRETWPLPTAWAEKWSLQNAIVPRCTGRTNKELGSRVTRAFRRYGVPFPPYDLRHAYALRTSLAKLPPAIAAAVMGHSEGTHCDVYHRFLDRDLIQAAWDRIED